MKFLYMNVILNSEYIAIIKPHKIEFINPMVQMVQCKVTKNFKNQLPKEDQRSYEKLLKAMKDSKITEWKIFYRCVI